MGISCIKCVLEEVSKGAKIRNRYNQVPHLTQDTNLKFEKQILKTLSQLNFLDNLVSMTDKTAHQYCIWVFSMI